MTVTALVWAWATVVCLAWGTLGESALRRFAAADRDGAPLPLHVACWLGLAIVTTLASVLSLVRPVDGTASLVLSVAGLGGLAAAPALRRTAWTRVRDAARALDPPFIALAVVVLAVALADAAAPPTNYDSGLYHVQAVRWIEAHRAVPGLGNLHFRLAMGSTWFVPEALFDTRLLAEPSRHLLVGCVWAWTALAGVAALHALARGAGSFAVVVRIAVLPLGLLLFRGWLSSPTPDVALALLAWTTIALAFEVVARGGAAATDVRVPAIALLAAFATGLKPSAAPLLLLPVALALAVWRREPRVALGVLAVALAVGLPQVARNVVLSGYPAFPVPLLPALPVDWAIPRAEVVRQTGWIMSWARLPRRSPHEVLAMPLRDWIGPWFARRTPFDRVLLGAIPLLALAALPGLRRPVKYPLAWGTLCLGATLWFALAPDPRFGWSFYPLLTLGLTARVLGGAASRLPRAATALALALGIAALCLWPHAGREPLAALAPHVVTPPPYPQRPLRTVAVRKLVLLAPERGDQCWDAALPCTPYPEPTIRRRGRQLERGFRRAVAP